MAMSVTSSPHYSGWIEKKDPFTAEWKELWCVLSTAAVEYYSDESMGDKKGYLPFVGGPCSVEVIENHTSAVVAMVSFQIHSSGRIVVMRCVEAEYEKWCTQLECIFQDIISDYNGLATTPIARDARDLTTCSIDNLREMCSKLQINCGQFSTQQQYISAITTTSPSKSFSTLRNRISEIEHDCFVEPPSKEVMAEVDEMFGLLLKKLGVENSLFFSLNCAFTFPQKILHLRNSICVLEDCPHFTTEDEIMLKIMDTDRAIDSIRLLTLQHRVLHATDTWLHSFSFGGGVSIVMENIENRMEKYPVGELDAAGMYHLLLCIKHIIKKVGLDVVFGTKGLIEMIVRCLHFEYEALVLEVLKLLCVCLNYGHREASFYILQGFVYLSETRGESPLEILVRAHESVGSALDIRTRRAIITLLNAMLLNTDDLEARLLLRSHLEKANFKSVLMDLKKNGVKREINSKPCSKLKRQESRRISAGEAVNEDDMHASTAEDRETKIFPERGLMAGFCSTENNDMWYELSCGILTWYLVKDGVKIRQGSQSMNEAIEILGYSTEAALQSLYMNCFMIVCYDRKYQLGVLTRQAKDQWIVALTAAMEQASESRFAYRIPHLPEISCIASEEKLLRKEITIFEECEVIDIDELLESCKQHKQSVSVEGLTRFLSQKIPSATLSQFEQFLQNFTVRAMDATFDGAVFVDVNRNGEQVKSKVTLKSATAAAFRSVAKKAVHLKMTEEIHALKKRNEDLEKRLLAGTGAVAIDSNLASGDTTLMESNSSGNIEISPIMPTPGKLGGGNGGALGALFGGRGNGPVKSSGKIGGRGAGSALGALFGGKGGGASPLKSLSVAAVKNSGRCAVTLSTRIVPCPPMLPGTKVLCAPPLPGQADTRAGELAKKTAIIPGVKMKGLFWNKMKGKQVDDTLWLDLEEPILEWELLEHEFYDPNGKVMTNTGAELFEVKAPPKPKVISLFDGKRTQNVSITVKKLRKSTKEIADMCIGLCSDLDVDVVEFMLNLVPSKDESAAVKTFDGDYLSLDIPGQLFHELIEIPRLQQRLEMFHMTLRWPMEMGSIYEQIAVLKDSCEELHFPDCQSALMRIMAAVLATGNFMNGGTARGQATAIKLDVLLKLENIKRSDGHKGTLMHFVVYCMQQIHPHDQVFFANWDRMWLSDKIDGKQLVSDIKKMEENISSAKKELVECEKMIEDKVRIPLRNKLVTFIAEAEAEIVVAKHNLDESFDKIQKCRILFGDSDSTNEGLKQYFDKDQTDCGIHLFFKLMCHFAAAYKVAAAELAQWDLDDERKAKKLMLEDEKKRKRDSSNSEEGPTSRECQSDVFDKLKNDSMRGADEVINAFKNRLRSIRLAVDDSEDEVDDMDSNCDGDWDQ